MSEQNEPIGVAIIGSGIAGYSAAIYAGRANNNPVVFKGDEPGGQLTLTSEVANYPGFQEGISGPELVENMKTQAKQFGARLENGIVSKITKPNELFKIHLENGDEYLSRSVIAASGASAKTLGISGEDELMGYGVSTCAVCDGAFFRDEDMVVVGGGDAAFEEAVFLTKFADTVYLVHRREEFRAEEQLQKEAEEAISNGEIQVLKNTEVTEIRGSKEEGIDSVSLVSHPEGHPKEKLEDNSDDKQLKTSTLNVGAVFIAIGHQPNTQYLSELPVSLTENGYLNLVSNCAEKNQTATEVDGLFGAGDVTDSHYQQAATASGSGVKAAIDVDNYLN